MCAYFKSRVGHKILSRRYLISTPKFFFWLVLDAIRRCRGNRLSSRLRGSYHSAVWKFNLKFLFEIRVDPLAYTHTRCQPNINVGKKPTWKVRSLLLKPLFCAVMDFEGLLYVGKRARLELIHSVTFSLELRMIKTRGILPIFIETIEKCAPAYSATRIGYLTPIFFPSIHQNVVDVGNEDVVW